MDVHVIDHPLAQSRLTAMRDARTDSSSFRAARRIVSPSGGLFTLGGQRLDRRDDAVRVVAQAVVAGLGAGES